jgi:hypothetical protein
VLSIIVFFINSILQVIFRRLLKVEIKGRFWDKAFYGVTVTIFDVIFFLIILAAIFGDFGL